MYIPPFTSSVWPVMYPASSDARNATAAAISRSVPARPSGTWRGHRRFCSSFSTAVIAVSMYPGATAFTVIVRLASSRARLFVSPISPAFDAA